MIRYVGGICILIRLTTRMNCMLVEHGYLDVLNLQKFVGNRLVTFIQ